jgi:hypothetical protein
MLTIKLMVSSKLSWENKLLQGKKPLPALAVAVSKHRAINYELTSSEISWWSPQNSSKEKHLSRKKTTVSTGSGFELAQGHELWAYMLTFKLMVISKLMWEKKELHGKNHCRYR